MTSIFSTIIIPFAIINQSKRPPEVCIKEERQPINPQNTHSKDFRPIDKAIKTAFNSAKPLIPCKQPQQRSSLPDLTEKEPCAVKKKYRTFIEEPGEKPSIEQRRLTEKIRSIELKRAREEKKSEYALQIEELQPSALKIKPDRVLSLCRKPIIISNEKALSPVSEGRTYKDALLGRAGYMSLSESGMDSTGLFSESSPAPDPKEMDVPSDDPDDSLTLSDDDERELERDCRNSGYILKSPQRSPHHDDALKHSGYIFYSPSRPQRQFEKQSPCIFSKNEPEFDVEEDEGSAEMNNSYSSFSGDGNTSCSNQSPESQDFSAETNSPNTGPSDDGSASSLNNSEHKNSNDCSDDDYSDWVSI